MPGNAKVSLCTVDHHVDLSGGSRLTLRVSVGPQIRCLYFSADLSNNYYIKPKYTKRIPDLKSLLSPRPPNSGERMDPTIKCAPGDPQRVEYADHTDCSPPVSWYLWQ